MNDYGKHNKTKIINRIALLIILILSSSIVKAQILNIRNHSIEGMVVNINNKMPLPGVIVILKGSYNLAITNKSGKYSIKNIELKDTLLFIYNNRILTYQIENYNMPDIFIDVIQSTDDVFVSGYYSKSDTSSYNLKNASDYNKYIPLFFRKDSSSSLTPIYILDGETIDELPDISEIAYLNVFTNESAYNIFGSYDAYQRGVIIITSKKILNIE